MAKEKSTRTRALLFHGGQIAPMGDGDRCAVTINLSFVTCEPDGTELRNPSDSNWSKTTEGRFPEAGLSDLKLRTSSMYWSEDARYTLHPLRLEYSDVYAVDIHKAETMCRGLKQIERFIDDLGKRGFTPTTMKDYLVLVAQATGCTMFLTCTRNGSLYSDGLYEKHSVTWGADYIQAYFEEFVADERKKYGEEVA